MDAKAAIICVQSTMTLRAAVQPQEIPDIDRDLRIMIYLYIPGLYLVWQTIAYSCKSKFQKCIETSFVRAEARGEGKARGNARAKAGVKMQGLGKGQVQGKVK